jgi:sugar O-acyltransferase (sialic acid O-acetyltransferase NeuD family)
MNKPVVLFGVGDFARTAFVYLTKDSPHPVAAFTVHRQYLDRSEMMGRPVVAFEDLPATYPPDRFAMFVAVGFARVNRTRAELYQQCKAAGYELISYICSRAVNWGEIQLGDNCFIFENNVLQPFVKLGNNVILWSGNHIGHDAAIGDHCFVTSHVVVSGNCKVGPYCFLGVNATLRDGITLGEGCVVGAGALVLKDLEPLSVVKGIPAELSKVTSDRLKGL